jgi:hypothetical protein
MAPSVLPVKCFRDLQHDNYYENMRQKILILQQRKEFQIFLFLDWKLKLPLNLESNVVKKQLGNLSMNNCLPARL